MVHYSSHACWQNLFILIFYFSSVTCTVQKPNIVLLLADDLGMGDVGCFGNDTIRTPNIDRIAREGVKLTHHLAAASVCTPSRAAFLTGRYPIRSGMVPSHVVRVNMFVSSTGGLPPSEITVAEVAKQNGYSTALIGKWHLGLHCETSTDFCHHPLKQGFDYFYGLPLTNLKDFGNEGDYVTLSYVPYMDTMIVCSVIVGILTAFLFKKLNIGGSCLFWTIVIFSISLALFTFWFYRNFKLLNSIIMRDYEVVEQPIRFENLTQRLVKESVKFMQEQVKSGIPFLLYIPWVQVHTVLHTAAEFAGRSQHGRYGDNVEELDWAVGKILDSVDHLGLKNNTFVYFSSDNGGHREERNTKGDSEGGWNGIYKGGKTMGGMDGGIRVPTAAMFPGRVPAGRTIHAPTSQMDVFTTVSSLLSIPLPQDRPIDGVNIWPLLTGSSDSRPHEFLFHYCGTEIHAARYAPHDDSNIWKIHLATPNWLPGKEQCRFVCGCYGNKRTEHNPPILYNIATDPSEALPLDSNTEKHKQIINFILNAIKTHSESVEHAEDQYDVSKMIPRPWLQPCCNFPSCDCVDLVHINGTEGG